MIYLVEDDAGIRELMSYTLVASGFQTRSFDKGESLWQALEKETPRLIILDIMLPGEDGLSILKKLRSRGNTAAIPVIMATAKGTEYDRVIGLDLGADDYLSKPFGMMEMVSRVKAVLRRTGKAENAQQLSLGGIRISPEEHTVMVMEKQVQLTLKEFELLLLFMGRPGHVYSREKLLMKVWGADYVGETRTVDVHIATLRSKLGACGGYIETVRGVGYRFSAEDE
ncbi:MAG: response regulator transcription factor [Clostridia bacterium]|nr:response regulator transcription factor [Clostridia bacterium]